MPRKYALNIGEDGRLLCPTFEEYATPGAILVDELPPGDVNNYRYIDGEYVYDPLTVEEVELPPTQEERIADLEEALELLLSGVTE